MGQYQKILLCFAMLLFYGSWYFYAFSQTAFSVERISAAEFENAKLDLGRYNATVITPNEYNDLINQLIEKARQEFDNLNSARKVEILEEIGEDFDFTLNQIIHIPDWDVYGLLIPTYSNDEVWWYNSSTGKFIYNPKLSPTAANKNGLYVSQILYDCDSILDLHFFSVSNGHVFEFASYRDGRFYGEYPIGEDGVEGIFWGFDNTLYIQTFDNQIEEVYYLKVQFK